MADDKFVGKEAEEEEDGEMSMLLKPTVSRSMSDSRQQRSRRKVQWNDTGGNTLTEVLEFEPSDSGDSDDKYGGPHVSKCYVHLFAYECDG